MQQQLNLLELCGKHKDFDRGLFDKESFWFAKKNIEIELAQKIDSGFISDKNDGNSWILYWLGLTTKKPDAEFCLFYYSPARATMPDFDMDFPHNKREQVVQYLIDKYGEDKVAQVSTVGRMKARASIRDVARALGMSDKGDILARQVQNVPGKNITVKGSIDKEDEWFSPELLESYESDDDARLIIDIAAQLDGLGRHTGVHAAAVMVGDTDLMNYTPLELAKSNAATTKYITQYEYTILESLGLLKIDVLGLSTLTVIEECMNLLGITYSDININDPEIYDLLSSGEVNGIFQVESSGMKRILLRLKPIKLEQIMDVISLYRPGPLKYIDSYIERSRGGERVQYPHPLVEDILKGTQGIMIYQEQVMKILQVLGGFSLGEADVIRKGMGKKKEEIVKKGRKDFIAGCAKLHNIDKDRANKIYDDIVYFAGYGFNRCVPYDTVIKKASSNQYKPLSVGEMYYAKNDLAWAKKNGKNNVGKKYRLNGYGYGLSMFSDERIRANSIVDIKHAGYKECLEIVTESGRKIQATKNHKFPTPNGIVLLENLSVGDCLYIQGEYEKTSASYNFGGHTNIPQKGQQGFQVTNGPSVKFYKTRELMVDNNSPCEVCGEKYNDKFELHHIDEDRTNNESSNLMWLCNSCHKLEHYKNGRTKKYEKGIPTITEKIVSIKSVGVKEVFDVEMEAPNHNFVVDSGIVTCNSHAASYARITAITAWLKTHYPLEYMATLLKVEHSKKEKVMLYAMEARRMGIAVLPPTVNISKRGFSFGHGKGFFQEPVSSFRYNLPEGSYIAFGYDSIAHVNDDIAAQLEGIQIDNQNDLVKLPFLLLNKRSFTNLIGAGVFDSIANRGILIEHVEYLMSIGKAYQEGLFLGQKFLFEPKLNLTQYSLISDMELSRLEKDAIGTWVRFHPASVREQDVLDIVTTDISQIYDMGEEYVTFLGVISSHNTFAQKDGKPMTILNVSDFNGTISCLCFNSLYEEVKDLIEDGALLLFSGTISWRREEPAIKLDMITNKISRANDRAKYAEQFKIKGKKHEVLQFIEEFIESNGRTIMHLFDGDTYEKIELDGSIRKELLINSRYTVEIK